MSADPLSVDELREYGTRPEQDDGVRNEIEVEDARFTLLIRKWQYLLAMAIIIVFLIYLLALIYFPPAREAAQDGMQDWAQSLLSTLFGAALAMSLGSLYSSDRQS